MRAETGSSRPSAWDDRPHTDDGRSRQEEKQMEVGRILTTEAAAILNVSPQFVRIAMQQGKLPIGTAVQMSSIWTYHISEKLLADYSGKDIKAELEKIREKKGA